jgi:iron-sulfur cluster repair protein YtfE (RIC family)
MKIKNILRELQYYLSIRQIGKTTLLKKGIDEYPYYHWIVVPTIEYGRNIISPVNKLHNLVSLDNLEKIRTTHQAMIIDQEANLEIFNRSLEEIEKLEFQVMKRKVWLDTLTKITSRYESQYYKLQSHMMLGDTIRFWELRKLWEFHQTRNTIVKSMLAEYMDTTTAFKTLQSLINTEQK